MTNSARVLFAISMLIQFTLGMLHMLAGSYPAATFHMVTVIAIGVIWLIVVVDKKEKE